ncbi:MAG: YoaK family protein [Janthinobacterium lividum]
MRRIQDGKPIVALLLITVSTGMLDAVSLLHLGTFTGYMTGTVILVGVHLAGGAELAWPGLVALAGFVLGAIAGGRLVRRRHPPPKLVGEVLLASAALVALAAAVDAAVLDPNHHFAVIAMLAFAMGLQTSATRHAGVTDMAMPAATMILHGLAHDSHLAGGRAERVWRRVGVLTGLLAGAAVGAALSNRSVPLSLLATALVAAGGGLVLRWASTE